MTYTHLGKIWWWVFPSAEVGQGPDRIAGRCETVRLSKQPEHDSTAFSCYHTIVDTLRQRDRGHLLLKRRQDATVQHIVSALSIISCYVPQSPYRLEHFINKQLQTWCINTLHVVIYIYIHTYTQSSRINRLLILKLWHCRWIHVLFLLCFKKDVAFILQSDCWTDFLNTQGI